MANFKTASTKNEIEDSTSKVKENLNIFFLWKIKTFNLKDNFLGVLIT